ncbi:GD13008 [Drosophila simulans]|uniref:GD13008 n=1 Tax=Drosophila simulans TaxID=7240 RepID=B4QLK3_DROSI|nr:GD13008 [Drosophila simulans]
MEECNFMELMEEMAVQFTVNKKEHQLFVYESRMISLTIQRQLVLDGAVFNDQLAELHKTASFVDKIYLDMPLNFEIFLPIRLPKPVVPTYDEKKRTVQFTRANYQHPFFFGNAVNFKCLNLLLQSELQRAISKLKTVTPSRTGRTYDIKYSVLSLNDVPFVHQVVALDRDSNGKRFIRFDFILAVEFNGADLVLPPYFKAPLSKRWIAYGRMTVDEDPNPAEWAVLVPKWQDASPGAALISLSCMVMLYRLMSAQQCYLFTLPGSIKLAFVMATEERGLDFQQISIADLTITFAVCFFAVVAVAAAKPGIVAPLAAAPLAYTAPAVVGSAAYVAPYASSYTAHSVAHSAAFPAAYTAAYTAPVAAAYTAPVAAAYAAPAAYTAAYTAPIARYAATPFAAPIAAPVAAAYTAPIAAAAPVLLKK